MFVLLFRRKRALLHIPMLCRGSLKPIKSKMEDIQQRGRRQQVRAVHTCGRGVL